MKLLHTHSNNPNTYIRVSTYNLVIWLNDLTDPYLRFWVGASPIHTMRKVAKEKYETISNI